MKLAVLHKRMCGYLYSVLAIISVTVILLRPIEVKASSVLNDVLNVIFNMTCETQGLEDLFTTEYAHTCTPVAISTITIAQIISPEMYLATMLRLKIGFDGLSYTQDNCLRSNRANNKNPTINFGMCSNIQLAAYRVLLVSELLLGVGGSSGTVAEALAGINPDYSAYHQSFINQGVGSNGIFVDFPGSGSDFTPVIPWYVTQNNDRICVSTYTIWGALLEVGCKYIAEPFPVGIYQQFFNNGLNAATIGADITIPQVPADAQQFFSCSSGISGCAQKATANSQALISVSSVIVECIRSTLLSTLVNETTCSIDRNGIVSTTQGGVSYKRSTFHKFQVHMQRAVMAFLTLYVIFTAFKLILAQGDIPPAGEFIMYALKVILVIYFSVGININGKGTVDGMTQWVFPLLLNMANEMAAWIGDATPSGLCVFDASSYGDMSRLVLWDVLDCKVMHYLGFDTLSSLFLGSASGDNLGHSVPPYIFLLIPALISGQINLAMLALAYPLVVMSVAAYLVTTFAICMIAITVLAVLAPIYVPFLLFEQTKGYFESWWKLMFSFTLQPVVIVGFMTVMFAVFDQGFYTDCEFVPISVEQAGAKTKLLFAVQTDQTQYKDWNQPGAPNSSPSYNTCTSTLGWLLNAPLANIAFAAVQSTVNGPGGAKFVRGAKVIQVPPPAMQYSDYQASFPAVNAIEEVSGVFAGYFSLLSNINKQMIINMFACLLMLYLMRELSGQMSEFAADIAGGVPLTGVTISPRSLTGDKLKEKLEDHRDNKKHAAMDKREDGLKGREEGIKSAQGAKEGKDGKGGSGSKGSGSSSVGSPLKSIGHSGGESGA